MKNTMKGWEQLPKRRRLQIYTGSEIREKTIEWLLTKRREAKKVGK